MQRAWKLAAAKRAAREVDDRMVVGLGSGTTMAEVVRVLGRRGTKARFIPASSMIEAVARRAGLKLVSLEECPAPDLHLDGADEISPELDLIKGKGGALTREKILARAARRVVIVADQTKLVRVLGDRAPVPVEVLPFAAALAKRELMLFGKARLRRRPDGRPVVTDNGNYIIDVGCGSIRKPAKLERDLKILTGVIENGIFANLADAAVVGYKNGVRVIESRSDFDSLWQEIT